MAENSSAIAELIDRVVVLDVSSLYVFVGTLVGHDDRYLILQDADVHDLRDTKTNREIYVLDSKRHGVRANRSRVLVCRDEIVSLCALEDVLE